MKIIKSTVALIMCVLLVLSLTACHKKNEVAVTINGIDFTSAMYSYALLNADSEAKSLVEEKLHEGETEEEKAEEHDHGDIDYFAQTIEDKTYEKWVEDKAVETLSKYAAYLTLCEENNVALDEEKLKEAKEYGSYYYSYYGALFSANGIGEETYVKLMEYDYLTEKYFTFLYGKEGSKAVAESDIKDYFTKNYRVALILQKDISELKEDEVNKAKSELEDWQKKIDGGKSLVEVYNEFNGLTEKTAESGYPPVKEIKDCVSFIADPEVDSNYGADFFKDIKDLGNGKTKIVEFGEDDSKQLLLVTMIDSMSDDTYLSELDTTIRWNLKSEEFDNDIKTYAATLKVEKNNYALKGFKVKDIVYQ